MDVDGGGQEELVTDGPGVPGMVQAAYMPQSGSGVGSSVGSIRSLSPSMVSASSGGLAWIYIQG